MIKPKFIKKIYLFGLLFIIPVIALGADFSLSGSTFGGIIDEIVKILNLLLPILTAVALILFFWGLSMFILNSGNQADLTKGKNYMFWGVLALFILITYKTIIVLVATNLDIGDGSTLPYITPTDGTGNAKLQCLTGQHYNSISQACEPN